MPCRCHVFLVFFLFFFLFVCFFCLFVFFSGPDQLVSADQDSSVTLINFLKFRNRVNDHKRQENMYENQL